MATIPAVRSSIQAGIELISWTDAKTGNTHTPILPMGTAPVIGAVQVTGTFGSGTCVLQGSIDGTNYATLKDVTGSDISFTAAGIKEFGTAVVYIRPNVTGGTADSLVVTVSLRNGA